MTKCVSQHIRELGYKDLRDYHQKLSNTYNITIETVRTLHLGMDDIDDLSRLTEIIEAYIQTENK
jgi:hypothetical protein